MVLDLGVIFQQTLLKKFTLPKKGITTFFSLGDGVLFIASPFAFPLVFIYLFFLTTEITFIFN